MNTLKIRKCMPLFYFHLFLVLWLGFNSQVLLGQGCVNPNNLPNGELEVCFGSTITFCPAPDDYCYYWSPAYLFYPDEINYSNTTTFEIEEPVEIILIKTDNNGNIVETININVTINDFLIELPESYEICEGGNITLEPIISGGSGNFSYLWDNGETTPTIMVSPEEITYYDVLITDSNSGCEWIGNTVVIIKEIPDFDIGTEKPAICQLGAPELQLNKAPTSCDNSTVLFASLTGEAGEYTYSWTYPDGTTVDIIDENSITVSEIGMYSVVISNLFGCTNSAAFEVLACSQVELEVSLIVGDEEEEYVLEAFAEEGTTFEWNNGSTENPLIVSEPGSYSVTATTPGECQSIAETELKPWCKMPETGYVFSPDNVGLLLQDETPIEFVHTPFYSSKEGQLHWLYSGGASYTRQYQDNTVFLGYIKKGTSDEKFDNGQDDITGLEFGFVGTNKFIRNPDNDQTECRCDIYKINLESSGISYPANSTGTFPGPLSYDSPLIPSSSNAPHVASFVTTVVNEKNCLEPRVGQGFRIEELLGLLSTEAVHNTVNANSLGAKMAEIPAYLSEQESNGCYYLYDRGNKTLTIYEAGVANPTVLTDAQNQEEIKTKLNDYYEGNIPVNKDYIAYFDLDNTQGKNLSFDVKYRDGALVPHAPYNGTNADEATLHKQARNIIKSKFQEMDSADDNAFEQELIADNDALDGKLDVKATGVFKWIAIGTADLKEVITTGEIPKKRWKSEEDGYSDSPYVIWVPVAGATRLYLQ